MVRGQKIDLAKLSIATLIGGFATAMDAALGRRPDGQLARWAVWTVMAATLTELWSRLLLPPDAPAARAAVEEAEALRRQLLDRARMRTAADWLERCVQLGRDAFRRGQPEVTVTGRAGDLTALLRACLVAMQVPEDQAIALRPRRRRCGPPAMPYGSSPACCPNYPMAVPWRPSCRASPTMLRGARCAVVRRCPAEHACDGALVLDQDADWMPILSPAAPTAIPWRLPPGSIGSATVTGRVARRTRLVAFGSRGQRGTQSRLALETMKVTVPASAQARRN
jgi:hypothetical protein